MNKKKSSIVEKIYSFIKVSKYLSFSASFFLSPILVTNSSADKTFLGTF